MADRNLTCPKCRHVGTIPEDLFQEAQRTYSPFRCPKCDMQFVVPGSPPAPTPCCPNCGETVSQNDGTCWTCRGSSASAQAYQPRTKSPTYSITCPFCHTYFTTTAQKGHLTQCPGCGNCVLVPADASTTGEKLAFLGVAVAVLVVGGLVWWNAFYVPDRDLKIREAQAKVEQSNRKAEEQRAEVCFHGGE